MKTSLLMSALCAAAIGVASLPSHAIMIKEDRISAAEGVLEVMSSIPATAFNQKWFETEGLTPGIGIVWRQIMLDGEGPDTLNPGGLFRETPDGPVDPLQNGPTTAVSEPPILLLIAAGLVGLAWSTRVLSSRR